MLSNYIFLALGIVCAGLGGELFIRGTVGLAHWARVSAGIIGVTVAAFATSSPELTVAISAALAGTPELSLGDALGSNVLNLALVLGLTLLLGDLHCPRQDVRRDFPVALLAPVLLGILALDGSLSRFDGLILLVIFLSWITVVTIQAARQRHAAEELRGEQRGWLAALYCLFGLVLLILAGRFIVTGASALAAAWGMDAFVIGAVIVAVGTSVPELATTMIAKMRGHDEVGMGTVLGSNIFNGLFIIGLAAVMRPIPIVWHEISIALIFGIVTVALVFPPPREILGRWRGVILLAIYAGYLAAILNK